MRNGGHSSNEHQGRSFQRGQEPPRVFRQGADGMMAGLQHAMRGHSEPHAERHGRGPQGMDAPFDFAHQSHTQRRAPGANAENGGSSGLAPLLGAAAAGFVAGLAANMGRKLVVEATTAVQGDWFEALKAEHRMVERTFQQILETDDTQTMKRTHLLVKLALALSKHDLEESAIIYPALRLHGRDGEGRHLNSDHGDIKAYLYELEELPKDDPNWINRIRAFQELVLEHVREEEEQIYPALRDLLTKEQNAKLTLRLHREGLKLA